MKLHLFLFLVCLQMAACKKTSNDADGVIVPYTWVLNYTFQLTLENNAYFSGGEPAYYENSNPVDPVGRYFRISAIEGSDSVFMDIFTDSLRPKTYYLTGNCVRFHFFSEHSNLQGNWIDGTFYLNISSNNSSVISGSFDGYIDFNGPLEMKGSFSNLAMY